MAKTLSVSTMRLLGGTPVFDFTNTVDSWGDRWGPDLLDGPVALANWAERIGLVDRRSAEQIRRDAEAFPDRAAAALERAKTLREAIYRVFAALAKREEPSRPGLLRIRDAAAIAYGVREPHWEHGRLHWAWNRPDDIEVIGLKLAIEAFEWLAEHSATDRVRCCPGPNCGWLFVDRSRNGSRRWCSEETCGMQSRVKRFRADEPQ